MSRLPRKPRLCFVGPMLGRNPGWVLSQGEILADLFARAGYTVRMTSTVPGRAQRLADTLRSLIAWRKDVDLVIHLVFSGAAFGVADLASMLTKRLGLPQVLALHGGSLPDFTQRHPSWARRVFGRADAVVSPSAYMVSEMDALFSGLGIDAQVIPNVLTIERYPFHERRVLRPRLLWMRTFHDVYHPQLAIEVLADVRRTHPEAILTMAGQDKGLLPAMQKLAAEKGLAAQVNFPGFLDHVGKVGEFASHDIYLNTNRVDNMPVSVIEAGAFGVPVVATRVGGIPYLLTHEETALLVPDGDVTGMAAAIRRLLSDPVLAGCLSMNGRRLAESCAWPPVKARWERLFADLGSKRRLETRD